ASSQLPTAARMCRGSACIRLLPASCPPLLRCLSWTSRCHEDCSDLRILVPGIAGTNAVVDLAQHARHVDQHIQILVGHGCASSSVFSRAALRPSLTANDLLYVSPRRTAPLRPI